MTLQELKESATVITTQVVNTPPPLTQVKGFIPPVGQTMTTEDGTSIEVIDETVADSMTEYIDRSWKLLGDLETFLTFISMEEHVSRYDRDKARKFADKIEKLQDDVTSGSI